jgi:hypothetical protein
MTSERLLTAAKLSVVLHLVATAVSLVDQSSLVTLGLAINLVLFLLGIVVFIAAFLIAAGRSRSEAVWFAGAFLLNGEVVDRRSRNLLRGCLAAQIVIGIAGASLAPFTPAAFSVLTPLLGFALMAFHGSRFGRFPSRAT